MNSFQPFQAASAVSPVSGQQTVFLKAGRKNLRLAFFCLLALLLRSSDALSAEALSSGNVQGSPSDSGGAFMSRIGKPVRLGSDEIHLKLGGESRYRFEYRDDFNLTDARYEDDAVNLLRNRLNLDLQWRPEGSGGPGYRFFAEGQAAQSFAESGLNKSSLFVNQLDLRQLFFETEKPFSDLPLTVKAGRQELAYGDERFVGPLNWTNTARVFDAVKTVWSYPEWLQLDAFFAQVVRPEIRQADKTVHDDNFYGLYASFKKVRNHVLDTFLFIRHTQDESLVSEQGTQRGDLREYTVGNRFKGKWRSLDYGLEYAVQSGRRAHDSIQAWALHQELGYTFTKVMASPRLYGEYNHASGDRNPTDGVVSTFDQLFPTNHNKYGLMDFMGLKNMNNILLGASAKPHAKLLAAAEFHWFFLDAKESPWYSASGSVFRAANAQASTHLGEEIDLYGTYALNANLSFLAGYSHFFPGPFAEDTGGDDGANFIYTQVVLKI